MPEEFKEIVCSLGLSYCSGLQALIGQDRKRITVEDSRKLAGSVPLDEDLKDRFPNDNRWDYVVAYISENRHLFFIEIHPACATSEAKKVVAKKEWLDNWLKGEGQRLKNYTSKVFYYWVATGRVPPLDSSSRMILAKKGIKGPVRNLEIK